MEALLVTAIRSALPVPKWAKKVHKCAFEALFRLLPVLRSHVKAKAQRGPNHVSRNEAHASEEQVRAVWAERIESLGYRAHPIPGAQRTAIGITGNKGAMERRGWTKCPAWAEVIHVSKPYKWASRDVKEEDTVIGFDGGRDLGVVAGLCSIESREQAFVIAERIAKGGARFFRGGESHKPLHSPYAFQGMGEDGQRSTAEIHQFGLRIVTEALDEESLHLVADYADAVTDARNMQNFSLLKKEAGYASHRNVETRYVRHLKSF